MALQKQNLSVPFAGGLDTKTDPFQVSPGKFISLVNSSFDAGGKLTKRNGFAPITTPTATPTSITTYKDGLIGIGTLYRLTMLTLGNGCHLERLTIST